MFWLLLVAHTLHNWAGDGPTYSTARNYPKVSLKKISSGVRLNELWVLTCSQ